MNIIQKILKSNTTTIGYDSFNEKNVKKIINFIPNVTSFEETESDDILEHFNSISYKRNYNLDSILNDGDKSVHYIVINLSSLIFKTDDLILRSKLILDFSQSLKTTLYNLSHNESSTQFKVIFLIQLNRIFNNSNNNFSLSSNSFSNNTKITYLSDLVIRLSANKLYIDKDRDSIERVIGYDTKNELREISINQILNDIYNL